MKEITVDKALKRYWQIRNVWILTTSIVFFAVFITIFFRIINYFSDENTQIIIIFFVIPIIGFLFAVLAIELSPTFNIWKSWAFSRVKNVHELKKRLILMNEISEESSFFKRIENSTVFDTKYWKLHLKFAQEDIFTDDKTIPEESCFYYSKAISIILITLLLIISAFGVLLIVMAIDEKDLMIAFFGAFFLIVPATCGYFLGYKKLKNREPQLILNSKGITTKKGFHKWEEIEQCIISPGNKASLGLVHSNGRYGIDIQELNIKNNGIKLSKLLMVYRERNKLQNSKKG